MNNSLSIGRNLPRGLKRYKPIIILKVLRNKREMQSMKSTCSSKDKKIRYKVQNTLDSKTGVTTSTSNRQYFSLPLPKAKVRTSSVISILKPSPKN